MHGENEVRIHVVSHGPDLLGGSVGMEVGVVAADAEDGEMRSRAARGDFFKMFAKGGVCAVDNAMRWRRKRVEDVGVVAAMRIEHRASAPMANLLRGDAEGVEGGRFAPAELGDSAVAQVAEEIGCAA